jgi:hypothetical protein
MDCVYRESEMGSLSPRFICPGPRVAFPVKLLCPMSVEATPIHRFIVRLLRGLREDRSYTNHGRSALLVLELDGVFRMKVVATQASTAAPSLEPAMATTFARTSQM